MNEQEKIILQILCEANENLTIIVENPGKIEVHKSRFLELDLKQARLVIDLPSADSPNTLPLQRNEKIEVYFTHHHIRYKFKTVTREHTSYQMRQTQLPALQIDLPESFDDGERREYFRIDLCVPPVIRIRFNVFKKKGTLPLMSTVLPDQVQEFVCELADLSGGGFSIKADNQLEIDRGDWIKAVFNLPGCDQEMVIWSELRNKRINLYNKQPVFGFFFLENEKNPFLKAQRNRIMRFVFNRQRESLSK